MHGLRRNFVFLPIYALLTQEAITNSVYTFFLVDVRGVALTTLAWLHSASDALILLLDVPMGYLADRLGRRVSLLAGAAAQAAGVVVMWRAASLPALAAGFLLIALGDALRSGADQALLYDSHRAVGETHAYRRRFALMSAGALAALAGGELLGGIVAHRVSFDHAWAAEALMSVIAMAIAWNLVEAPHDDQATAAPGPANVVGEASRGSWSDVIALGAFAVSASVLPALACFLTPFELRARGHGNTETLGILLAARHLLQAAMGWISAQAWVPATAESLLVLGTASLAGLLMLMVQDARSGLAAYAACLLAAGMPRGMATTVASELVNRHLAGRYRATALSAISVGERLVVVPLIPLLAHLAARGAFAAAYGVLASLLALALVLVSCRMLRRWARVASSEVRATNEVSAPYRDQRLLEVTLTATVGAAGAPAATKSPSPAPSPR